MSAPFKMTPGKGTYQKTGKGIPMSFQSPLNQKSFQDKLAAAKKKISDKNTATGLKRKAVRQDNVLDSLNTVADKGEKAAAIKYGNKARAKASKNNKTGALPEDASEANYKTEKYAKDSALKQKKKPTYEEAKQKIKDRIANGKKVQAAKSKATRQSSVLDSLNTVADKGERAAAEKYGNKARKSKSNKTGALPEDASENSRITEQYKRKSKTIK